MPDTTPADQLRAAAGHAPSPELARLLETLADASDHHPTGEGGVVATVVHPALAVARQLLGTNTGEDTDADVIAELGDGGVRCPLCSDPLMLHTPSGARAHFTHVHPEQRITGRQGPWPVLVDEQQPPTPADLESLVRENARLRAELEESRAVALSRCRTLDEHDAAVPPVPADRAAVLAEAAEAVALDRDATSGPRSGARQGMTRAVTLLRSLAGEAPASPSLAARFEALAAEWERRGEYGDSSITDRARELRAVLAAAPAAPEEQAR
ncbi:hypothetical protein ACIQH0_37760 [Streptomyces griseus]|uniref:hypothetical protein n=1 Tax=Streptomyces griseus TaxID=1911 RepID=UPI003817E356